MNAKIYSCAKCYSFSFESVLEGIPLRLGVPESIKMTESIPGLLPILDLSAIQPVNIVGIQISIQALNQLTGSDVAISQIGLQMQLSGERPTDTIATTNVPNSDLLYFGDFGISYMDFSQSEPYRNVTNIEIQDLVAYTYFDDYNGLVNPTVAARIGITINLYYI